MTVVLGTILVLGGLATFLLYPRDVVLTVHDYEALKWEFGTNPWIVIKVRLLELKYWRHQSAFLMFSRIS